MTYLTKVRLDLRDRGVRRDLSNCDGLHKRVMSLVGDDLGDTPRLAGGVLYRLEQNQTGARLLVQTNDAPVVRDNRRGILQMSTTCLDPLLDQLEPGCVVRYLLVANPTRSTPPGSVVSTGDGVVRRARGGRVQLKGSEAWQWWLSRAAAAGLVDVSGTIANEARFAAGAMRLNAATFTGFARVSDAQAVQKAVVSGVGRGKSYGLGLLSVVPARPES